MRPLGWNMNKGASVNSGTGGIRQFGHGHLKTDYVWDSIDTIIEVWMSHYKRRAEEMGIVLFSVSQSKFTSSSQVTSGRAHGWSFQANTAFSGQHDIIGLSTAYGEGDVYRWSNNNHGYLVYTQDASHPILNRICFDYTKGWDNVYESGFLSINGGVSDCQASGTMIPEFPSQPMVFFAHSNPDGGIIDLWGNRTHDTEGVFVHSITFRNVSTGKVVRDFVSKNNNGEIGMYDLVTKNFYPTIGSFEYTDNCVFAEQVG